jgi:precorrin-4 methylase
LEEEAKNSHLGGRIILKQILEISPSIVRLKSGDTKIYSVSMVNFLGNISLEESE